MGLRIQPNCHGLLSIYTNFNTHFYWVCETICANALVAKATVSRYRGWIVTACYLFILILILIFIGLVNSAELSRFAVYLYQFECIFLLGSRIQPNCHGLLFIYTNFNPFFYWGCEFSLIVTVCCLFKWILIHFFIEVANSAELSRFAVYLYEF